MNDNILKEKSPHAILSEAIDKHKRNALYGTFSGGKDSILTTYLAATQFKNYFKGVIYCDTGIGTNATKQYVKSFCKEMNYKLNIVYPKKTFREICIKYGFPGQSVHSIIMRNIKYAPMRKFILAQYKTGQRPAVLSGMRKHENKKKRIAKLVEIVKDGRLYLVSPYLYTTNSIMHDLFIRTSFTENPVYRTLHISGNCLCGCFAQSDEYELLKIFHPEVSQEIDIITDLIKSKGTQKAKKYPVWGNPEPNILKEQPNQSIIDSFVCGECRYDNNTENMQDDIAEIDNKLKQLN